MATQTRSPTGNGATSQWTGSANPASPWLDVSDASDSTYISRADSNGSHVFAFTAFDIASSAIASLTVTFRAARTAAGACTAQARIRVGGTSYNGTQQALTETITDLTEVCATNPATSVAWVEADIEGHGRESAATVWAQ